jgi:uncharacterized cupin superfamily protein
MPRRKKSPHLVTSAALARTPEVELRHPFNPNSQVHMRRLGQPTGMRRLSLAITRLPPGKESFAYHAHERDEEFIYILSGRGRAEIDDEIYEVGPGDFMGFPAPSVGHHLTNPYDKDLIYLMGGESSGFDIGIFPRLGRRLIFSAGKIHAVNEADLQPMTYDQWRPKKSARKGAKKNN